jgi:hypothetical protein
MVTKDRQPGDFDAGSNIPAPASRAAIVPEGLS